MTYFPQWEPGDAASLSGSGTLVDVQSGWSATYQAIGIKAFFESAADPEGAMEVRPSLHYAPGDPRPTLLDANTEALTGDPDVIRSKVIQHEQIMELDWQRSANNGLGAIDAISSVLMVSLATSSFNVEPALDADTELVLTMPTLHHYAGQGDPESSLTRVWASIYLTNREGDVASSSGISYGGACGGDYCIDLFTESSTAVVAVMQPAAGDLDTRGGGQNALLNDTPTRLLGSVVSTSLPAPGRRSGTFDTGTVGVSFHGGLRAHGDAEIRLNGFPLIGFELTVLHNGTLTDESGNRVLSTYALVAPLQVFDRR